MSKSMNAPIKLPFQVTLFLPLIVSAIGWADPLDTWTLTTPSPTRSPLAAVAFGNGQFVAVGGGPYTGSEAVIVSSTDGIKWVKQQPWTNTTLAGITYASRQFVVSGFSGIATSTDAVNWVPQPSAVQEAFGVRINTADVAYGNGLFVAVGAAGNGPAVLRSSDGINWINSNARGPFQLNAVAYGNGRFVAVGEFGVTVTFTDGMNWDGLGSSYSLASNSPALRRSDQTTAIAYGGGRFVFVNNAGGIGASTDGLNWTVQQLFPNEYITLNGITYGNGRFVAVGNAGIILSSSDGSNWVKHQPGTRAQLLGIGYGNGHFVAVGENGTILESGPIINLSMTPSPDTGLLSLSVEGPTGLDYTIQSSNDLVTWKDVTTITGSPSGKITLDGLPLGQGNLFYRAQSQ